ncbi:MAG: hypothetical protein SVX43_15385 [Cyanobacteriota bacterium]|nr:hypothetical protein [Cyanobacteriota bacterium]
MEPISAIAIVTLSWLLLGHSDKKPDPPKPKEEKYEVTGVSLTLTKKDG